MDLNFKRRKQEMAVATAVTNEISNHAMMAAPLSPEQIGMLVASACERLGVTFEVSSGERILSYVSREITRRTQAVNEMASAVEASR